MAITTPDSSPPILEPKIRSSQHLIPSASPILPDLLVQLTRLSHTTMIWVGVQSGSARLAELWTCSMPPLGVCHFDLLFLQWKQVLKAVKEQANKTAATTVLYCSSKSEVGPSLSARLSVYSFCVDLP